VRIVWTRLALRDLDHARDFIAAANPKAARDTIERIDKALAALLAYPDMGRPGQLKATRELVIVGTPFFIPYRVRDDRIELLGVIHSVRKWPDGK
jgi:addiction module RelE/StbE family toxin